MIGNFAERFAGSSDLFREHGRKPTASVNFVTSHDGFTLHDLVAYNERHNEANLENGADGHAHNLSWNCGVEGPTEDPAVLELRGRQMRNLLASLFLSQGVPMLRAGDEMAQTQLGNNNAYCQDNELSWIDWSEADRRAELIDFVGRLADLRRSRLWLRRDTFLKGTRRFAAARDVTWLHPAGREMTEADWGDGLLRCLAVQMSAASYSSGRSAQEGDLLAVFNADEGPVDLVLPKSSRGEDWRVLIDTSQANGAASTVPLRPPVVLRVGGRSTILLESSARDGVGPGP
jgi:glycogen operon protein